MRRDEPLEISTALEASEDLKDLFRMSEQQLGRPLRHIEQKSLVWMHDGNNIGSEIILTVLLYCKSIDKCSVNYAESIITQWWNEGIHTLTQVNDAINDMEYRRSFTGHIQKAFEMHRKPTTKQQEFIDMWQDKKIPMELITYAYEKTVESTGKLVFEYLNSILTRWTEAGSPHPCRRGHERYPAQQQKDRQQTRHAPKRKRRRVSVVYL